VAAGTTMSAVWILALNSWMHTPAGFEMINGQAHVTSWLQVIFNPSFPYRFSHMLLASGLTVSFLWPGCRLIAGSEMTAAPMSGRLCGQGFISLLF
jgi:cytochrome d ubiquinol oxidase subunit I